jgi:hypothetical protein
MENGALKRIKLFKAAEPDRRKVWGREPKIGSFIRDSK